MIRPLWQSHPVVLLAGFVLAMLLALVIPGCAPPPSPPLDPNQQFEQHVENCPQCSGPPTGPGMCPEGFRLFVGALEYLKSTGQLDNWPVGP